MDMTKEALDRLLQVGDQLQAPRIHDGLEPFAVIGGNVVSLAHLGAPTRIKRKVALIDAGSFCDYVNRFKNPDTLIFAKVTPTGATLTAIIDYHGAPVTSPNVVLPRYCDHLATLDLVETEDWKRWTAANRKAMTQVEFATWLEDNAALFNSVKEGALKGAELLELVQTLFGTSDVSFTSLMRLKNGTNRLNYIEDSNVRGEVEGEPIELPAIITAALQPFDGGPSYAVDARLKTRIEGRKLSLWFETVQMHKIIRDAVLDTVKMVSTKTGLVPLLGS